MIYNRVYCMALSLIYFSNGAVLAQKVLGIVKSGSGLTSSVDSASVIGTYLAVGAKHCEINNLSRDEWYIKSGVFARSMGDDFFGSTIEDIVEKFRACGYLIKEHILCNIEHDDVEYCGHIYSKTNGVKLLRWHGSFARLLQKHFDCQVSQHESLAGLHREMRNMPEEFIFLLRSLKVLGWWEQQVT